MTSNRSPVQPLLGWAYRHPRYFPIATDFLLWPIGVGIGALLLGATNPDSTVRVELVLLLAVLAGVLNAALGYARGLYRRRWRVSSFNEVAALAQVWVLSCALCALIVLLLDGTSGRASISVLLLGGLISLGLVGAERIVWRRAWERIRRPDEEECLRTLVFGAGDGGEQIVRAMRLDPGAGYFPVAVLDDDPTKRNREVDGVPVMGTRNDIARVARNTQASIFLIAIPSAASPLIEELSERATAAGLEVRVLPSAAEIVGQMQVADVRPPTVEDLLGRDPVDIDLDAVSDYVRGKRVLVTGAGGSIGSELSRQIAAFEPSELYLLDRDETALHGLQLSMEGRALLDTDMLVVADIRDRSRMFELFERYQPEVVFHTAALKHLTLLENHPEEGVKTNTYGTLNLLNAAQSVGVERFVNISTDKAADPTSVLGATKLAAERLTAQCAAETGLPYVSVRFGNVLGSRGSVLPTFMGQIEQGVALTVTHPDVTRYFMTIPEAVRLVVQAGAIGEPGEVMILDMGEPVRIVDLADKLISLLRPGTPIEFTGLRPGEKLHEILIGEEEVGKVRSHPRITHTSGNAGDPADALAGMGHHVVRSANAQFGTVAARVVAPQAMTGSASAGV